jgi:hypothetical protein
LIRASCKLEPIIDQSKPVNVAFFSANNGAQEVVKIEFTTVKGYQAALGLAL